jgi:hypothetical protein
MPEMGQTAGGRRTAVAQLGLSQIHHFALKFEACVTRARAIPLRRPDCCPEAAELASVFIAVQEEEIDHFVQSHTSAHAVIPSDGMPDF